MEVYHNSYDEFYREPFGAVKVGEKIRISIKISQPWNGIKIYLCIWNKDDRSVYDMHCDAFSNECIFYIEFEAPSKPTLLWYHFILENYDGRLFYGNNDRQLGGVGRIYESNPISYQITIYEQDEVPNWYKEGIVYQIFPDRFNRGKDAEKRLEAFKKYREFMNRPFRYVENWNEKPCYDKDEFGNVKVWDFYGGTFEGIREKLPYLKSLNITAIYLNPIFEARSNHRYDTGDYMTIDPMLGDEASFVKLIKEAKKMGIHIIIDGVFNHTGSDSKYFNKYGNYSEIGAYQSEESQYREWYNFGNDKNEYQSWWGVKDLPSVNENKKSYIDFIYGNKDSVVRYWIKKGVDGWRLDVADELPDSFIEGIRNAMLSEKKDSLLIGEVWEDASNKISYGEKRKYLFGGELQSIMNYPYRDSVINYMRGKISSNDLTNILMHYLENYPKENFYANLNILDSHDKERIITTLSDIDVANIPECNKKDYKLDVEKRKLAKRRLKVLIALQFTMPGVPCIYYGDEVGVEGFTDPYNRATYPWGNEDEEILENYKEVTKLRTNCTALKNGDIKPIAIYPHVFGYFRKNEKEKVLCLFNRAIFDNEICHIEIELDKNEASKYCDLIKSENNWHIENNKLICDMKPLSYIIIGIKKNDSQL